jgi:hypothetical protein
MNPVRIVMIAFGTAVLWANIAQIRRGRISMGHGAYLERRSEPAKFWFTAFWAVGITLAWMAIWFVAKM